MDLLATASTGMRLQVRHLTRFHYDGPVLDSYNDARLCPVDDALQRCTAFALNISPIVPVRTYRDFYFNRVDHFELHEPHDKLAVEAVSSVETIPDARGPIPSGLTLQSLDDPALNENYFDFVAESRFVTQSAPIWREALDVLENAGVTDLWNDALKLGRHVHETFSYDPDWTHVHTNAAEAIADRRGVCQDYAHVMIALCRSHGIPARYVSGYYHGSRAGDENEASHAWVEIYLPHYGWKGFDATHNRETDTRYVKIAIGRDYGDIKPVSGSFRGRGSQHIEVEVKVRLAQ